jgi:hypothetical protein
MAVDYVPFATGGGANVYAPATYQGLAVVGTGVQPGLADPQLANTTWRLASMIAAAVANYIAQQLGISVLDDGNLTNLINNFTSAVALGSKTSPSRIVSSSANFNALVTDYAIGMNRTAGIAITTITLPTPAVGQEFRIDDLAGNFNGFPVTLALPAGHSFPENQATAPLNVNRQSVIVHYYGSSLWGLK